MVTMQITRADEFRCKGWEAGRGRGSERVVDLEAHSARQGVKLPVVGPRV